MAQAHHHAAFHQLCSRFTGKPLGIRIGRNIFHEASKLSQLIAFSVHPLWLDS
jgi:hypothetical protein